MANVVVAETRRIKVIAKIHAISCPKDCGNVDSTLSVGAFTIICVALDLPFVIGAIRQK